MQDGKRYNFSCMMWLRQDLMCVILAIEIDNTKEVIVVKFFTNTLTLWTEEELKKMMVVVDYINLTKYTKDCLPEIKKIFYLLHSNGFIYEDL
ncbi:hypothetical protein AX16_010252 [Volvariella volvacea WC 439]|nr:hypothetical protein AX16_010252 [Volvariella volvacea WC 439]